MPTPALADTETQTGPSVAMSALSELLTQANTEGLSLDKITDMMRASGHDIGRDTVWKYMSGRHAAARTEYLRAFVDIFPSLKLEQLQRAAKIPPGLGEWKPPAEAERLSKKERAALDALIKGIVQERERAVLRGSVETSQTGRVLRSVEAHQDEVPTVEAALPIDRSDVPHPGTTTEPDP